MSMSKIDIDKLKTDVLNKWEDIFASLSINVGCGEHRPCPVCGGADRFRFDNRDGGGSYICNQCGAGDGWSLVQKTKNVDFIGAAKMVSDIVGGCDMDEEKDESKSPDAKKMIRDIWSRSATTNGETPVDYYLRSRGLLFVPKVLKYCPTCFNTERGCPIPAMIAPVQNPDGKGIALHRTYLTPEGKKASVDKVKMLTPVTGKINGGAIRLFPIEGDTMGVAEGIETAISCIQLFGIPTWATVSSTIMESFEPPEEVRKIIIYSDNDANFTGQHSAFKLAKKLYGENRIVEVLIPDITGDFNDVLNNKKSNL